MSFFSKLFGGGKSADSGVPKILSSSEHKGYMIEALEMKQGSEFMLCGQISKEFDGETKIKKFIRADRLTSAQQAADTALRKGVQIIDQEGDALFDSAY